MPLRRWSFAFLVAALWLASGCWYVAGGAAGVASVVGGGGSSSGGPGGTVNANTTAQIIDVPRPAGDIQEVLVKITDPEGDAVPLRLDFRDESAPALATGEFQPAVLVEVVRASDGEVVFAGGTETGPLPSGPEPDGIVYIFRWNWKDAIGESSASIVLRLSVVGSVNAPGGVAQVTDALRIGNERAQVQDVTVVGRSGIVRVNFELRDAGSDACNVEAKFVPVVNDIPVPDGAKVIELPPGEEGALTSLATTAEFEPFFFFWDTEVAGQVGSAQLALQVQLTPVEASGLRGDTIASTTVIISNNTPPQAVLTPPARSTSGSLAVGFRLIDAEGDASGVVGGYRLEGETQFTLATPVTPLGTLAASPTGTAHAFTWSYAADFAARSIPASAARRGEFRIGPSTPGAIAGTASFLVGNDAPEPIIVGTTSPQPAAPGLLSIDYTLLDRTGDIAAVVVEYGPTSAGPWSAATPSGTATIGLATSADAANTVPKAHVFVWDTVADLPDANAGTFFVRVTANDGLPGGARSTDGTFEAVVDNVENRVPVAAATTPGRTAAPTATIEATVRDLDGEEVQLAFSWRREGDPDYTSVPALLKTVSADADGTAAHFVWDYVADGPGAAQSRVFVRITPTETRSGGATGTAGDTAGFFVGNTAPAVAIPAGQLAGEQAGIIGIRFTLLDPAGDLGTIVPEYKVGLSGSFETATLSTTATALATLAASDGASPAEHTLLWRSKDDLPDAAGDTITFRIKASDALAGSGTSVATVAPDFTLRNATGGAGDAFTVEVVSPGRGTVLGGDVVTVAGSGFGASAAVEIGGAAATVVGVTETAITVRTPAGTAGPKDVVVRMTGPAREATLEDGFTYAPAVTFLATRTVTGIESGATEVRVVLEAGGAPIATAFTVTVSDLAIGSATSGADYQALAPVILTFPAGSPDGTLRAVTVTAIDDAVSEGDETIFLGLGAPSIDGAIVGAIATHRFVLTDDEPRITSFTIADPGVNPADYTAQVKGERTLAWTLSKPPGATVKIDPDGVDVTNDTTLGGRMPFQPADTAAVEPRAFYRIEASLAGALDIAELTFAESAGGAGTETVRGMAAYPDGSTIVAGEFAGDIYVARFDAAGDLAWEARSGASSAGAEDAARGVAILPDGGAIVVGTFQGSADFFGEGGATPVTTVASTSSSVDAFLAKYKGDGTLEWARAITGAGAERANGVCAMPDGGFLVTGSLTDDATFDGVVDIVSGVAGGSALQPEAFIARFDASGGALWATRLASESGGSAAGFAVAAYRDSWSVITGSFSGDLGPEPLASAGGTDLFVAIFEPAGAYNYAERRGGPGDDAGLAIDTYNDLATVFCGRIDDLPAVIRYDRLFNEVYTQPLTGPGEARAVAAMTDGSAAVAGVRAGKGFLARLTGVGILEFLHEGGAEASAMDGLTDGALFMAGTFAAPEAQFGAGEPNATTLTANGASSDIFIARYDPLSYRTLEVRPEGLAWLKGTDTEAAETGSAEPFDCVICADGDTVVVGGFKDEVIFGPGPGQTLTASGTLSNSYVARYAADGTLKWVAQGVGADTIARGVCAALDGSVIVSGRFTNTATFGDTVLDATGDASDQDYFVVRYDPSGAEQWAVSGGTTGNDDALDVAIRPDGHLWVAGKRATNGAFLARHSGTDGSLLGAVTELTASSLAVVNGVAALPDGGAAIAGNFEGTFLGFTADLAGDAFVARYDLDGNQVWAEAMAGADQQVATSVVVAGDATIHVGGGILSDADTDPGTLTVYSLAGAFVQQQQFATTSGDTRILALAPRVDGSVVATGFFEGRLDFGNGVSLDAGGQIDAFLVELAGTSARWSQRISGTASERGTGVACLGTSVAVAVRAGSTGAARSLTAGVNESNETSVSFSQNLQAAAAKFFRKLAN